VFSLKIGEIFSVIIVVLGIIGWILGFYFGNYYWLETGHSYVYSLGQLAQIIGPIVTIGGVLLFTFFNTRGTHQQQPVSGSSPPEKTVKRSILFATIIVALVALAGISLIMNDQYNRLQSNYDTLSNSYSSLQANYAFLNDSIYSLQADYSELESDYGQLLTSRNNLNQALGLLQTQYNSLLSQYNQLTMLPSIRMTDIVLDHAYEQWYVGTQTIGASFNLVNDGQVDGFITVRIGGGGTWWGENTYFVQAGTSVHKDFMIYVDSQLAFTTGIEIVRVFR